MKKKKISKVIKGKTLEDKFGSYIGFCHNPRHTGIVRYRQYKVCERIRCEHYEKYRPEWKGWGGYK